MSRATIVIMIGILLLDVALYIRSCTRGLPHRPVTELTNWGQGHAPPNNHCPPGTVRFETDDGLFLECFRGTT